MSTSKGATRGEKLQQRKPRMTLRPPTVSFWWDGRKDWPPVCSLKCVWVGEVGRVISGVQRQPRRRVQPESAVIKTELERWMGGWRVSRCVLSYQNRWTCFEYYCVQEKTGGGGWLKRGKCHLFNGTVRPFTAPRLAWDSSVCCSLFLV